MEIMSGLEAAVYLKPSRCGCKKTSVPMWHRVHIAQRLSATFDVMEPAVAREKLYCQRILPLATWNQLQIPRWLWTSVLACVTGGLSHLNLYDFYIQNGRQVNVTWSRDCKAAVEGFGAPDFFLSWLCKSFPAQFMASATYFGSNWIKWKLPITSC